MAEKTRLSKGFFTAEDTVLIAKQLLGKKLYTQIDGELCSAIIVETEAYKGPQDVGSHAFNNKRTTRNEVMYHEGGVVYMYICYGIHDMLNIVTGPAESSHAVLIRALEPVDGIAYMQRRRMISDIRRLCKGPGALSRAMGLNKRHNGISLQGDQIWIEDSAELKDDDIIKTSRVGLNIDEPFKSIAWRFYIKGNIYISKK